MQRPTWKSVGRCCLIPVYMPEKSMVFIMVNAILITAAGTAVLPTVITVVMRCFPFAIGTPVIGCPRLYVGSIYS